MENLFLIKNYWGLIMTTDKKPIKNKLQLIDDVLKSGDPIPSVRQMAVEGGVNPLTVSKAYQELVDLKIVEKRRGLGMFITEHAKRELLRLEKSKFLSNEWPSTLKRAESLGIDLIELLDKKSNEH